MSRFSLKSRRFQMSLLGATVLAVPAMAMFLDGISSVGELAAFGDAEYEQGTIYLDEEFESAYIDVPVYRDTTAVTTLVGQNLVLPYPAHAALYNETASFNMTDSQDWTVDGEGLVKAGMVPSGMDFGQISGEPNKAILRLTLSEQETLVPTDITIDDGSDPKTSPEFEIVHN